jgi:tetratricopeptide (TPR) repeat protein
MRKPIAATMLALAGLFLTPSGARAQETNVEEVVAYQMFYQASQAGDAAKALEAAQAYVKQFPEGPNAAYIKKWLAKATAQTRGAQFNQALKEGNSAELIRIGREQLAEKPDDLSYLISLAVNLRKNVLLGSQKNPEWTAAAGEFSAQALKLIEGGALPPGTDPAKWNKDATLSLLYQNVAIAAQRADKNDDALQAYEKSLALGGNAASLAAYSGFYCGKLRKDKYDAAVAAYQSLPEDKRAATPPAPEAQTALDEVNAQADATIECWAVFVGATQKTNPFGDARAPVDEALKALYTSRHPGSPEGLQALIARHAEK